MSGYLVSAHAWRPARSTLVRVLIPFCVAKVVALSHYINGIARWSIPVASYLACIVCHLLVGDRNGEAISRCTMERGDIDVIVTDTLSSLGVSSANLGIPGGRHDNSDSVSSSISTPTSLGARNTGIITTDSVSWPSRISLSKLGNFPSSGVGLAKDRVTNWVT